MTKHGLPLFILLTGLSYIFVIPSEPEAVRLLFKLIPMWLIIAYAFTLLPAGKKPFHWLLLIGLFFCMLGDGLLGWFIVGLSAFLIGHLFYMSSFFSRWKFSWPRLLTIVPIAGYAFLMGRRLVDALQGGDNAALAMPVILYICVISLMTWSAIMTGNRWAIVGSLLFTASDSVLAWNRFVSEVTFGGELVMLTYYTAQFFIARSVRAGEASTLVRDGWSKPGSRTQTR